MSLFPSSFSLFLDGQSIVVMERGGRGSADHFPTEAESDVGHVPSSSRRNRVLAPRATPAPARRNRSCRVLGVFWDLAHLLFEISQVFRSMRQCEIQARQVSGQEPDFSKMTNLAGKKPLLVFFNSQTGGTGVPQDGDSRGHSGSARPGWAVLGLNATRP